MYLVHHGIKGQKWGVRRYQNEDGTLTRAGKERYSDDNGKDYKPNKFVDSRSNYTPTRHYMQYMSDHGGTSGRINPPKYSGFSEKDKGRNNRYEEARKENSKYGSRADSGSQLHLDRKINASDSMYGNTPSRKMHWDIDGAGHYHIGNNVQSRVNEYNQRQTAREATLQAPGSDRMERANIADAKGPYMSDEYRRELEYNSKKNQYPSVGSDGAPEFDIPNESERARERAKKEYEEWYDKYNKEVTKYITPYQDIEFVDINQFESNPRNKITPDLDGKVSSGPVTIKQYNDRSKDHTSKSYNDRHSIDTKLNSQLANIQKKDYSEHINAAIQRGVKEVTSIIRHVLTKNKTKTDNKKRK